MAGSVATLEALRKANGSELLPTHCAEGSGCF